MAYFYKCNDSKKNNLISNLIGIVVLNYNNWEDTVECVDSVEEHICTSFVLIIVDNCSTNSSYTELSKRLPKSAIIVKSEVNLGYAGGNNIGIRKAMELGCNYICILNNDTVVTEDFLYKCVSFIEDRSDAGFVGPAIVDFKTHKIQSTGGDIPLIRDSGGQKNNGKNIDEVPNVIEATFVGGACIIASVQLIEKIGLIPENYFLFYEETEWCYRAQSLGYKNFCLTTTSILHKGSVAIKKISGLNEYLLNRNRIVFNKRNRSLPIAFSIFLLLCVRAVISCLIHGDKNTLNRITYYRDGWTGDVDLEKYPFIIIRDNEK